MNELLTHCNAIDFGGISKGIIFIEGVLGESNCGMNCWIKVVMIEHASGEDLINIVHGWDNHGKVGCTMREKQGCILEDLEFD